MRVAIAGCHGFIGGHLVDRLLAEGHDVVGFDDRARPSWAKIEGSRIELSEPRSVSTLARALDGCEAVFHLLAKRPDRLDETGFFRGTIQRTSHLLQAARLAGVKRLVHSSTLRVLGRPDRSPVGEDIVPKPETVFEATKRYAERLVEIAAGDRGTIATVLRYTTVYGPRRRSGALFEIVRSAVHGQTIELRSGGRSRRDLVDVRDVASANVLALERQEPGLAVYHIGGGEAPSERELADRVRAVVGRNVDVRVTEDPRDPGHDDPIADISLARASLGFEPTPLPEGILALVEGLTAEVTS